MKRTDFSFDLPPELVAQYPSAKRGEDRLMVLDRETGEVRHRMMKNLPDIIPPGALMVFNDSRVRKARVFAKSEETGKETEFLFVEKVTEKFRSLHCVDAAFSDKNSVEGSPGNPAKIVPTSDVWLVMVKKARKQKTGSRYTFGDGSSATLLPGLEGTEFRYLALDTAKEAWFERNGRIPLPPYISRESELADSERYQTVYARETGSSAAPTAGLHFTVDMLNRLTAAGIEQVRVTLHVGAGTFLPVRTDRIEDHAMHRETYSISPAAAAAINGAKRAGRPVVAVGTTAVRTLEAAARSYAAARYTGFPAGVFSANHSASPSTADVLSPGSGATDIFLYPGAAFRVVDALFTNFHTPESTLLMLVCAFAGRNRILAAYAEAIREGYRFFSYGDAMYIDGINRPIKTPAADGDATPEISIPTARTKETERIAYAGIIRKIDDIPELRIELENVFHQKNHEELVQYSLLLGRHILEITGMKPSEEMQEGFDFIQKWQKGETGKGFAKFQGGRNIAGKLLTQARDEKDPVKAKIYRIMADVANSPHVKNHALWASDSAVQLINKLYPRNLGEVKKERELQIRLMKNVCPIKTP